MPRVVAPCAAAADRAQQIAQDFEKRAAHVGAEDAIDPGRVEGIAGVNLPMLIKLASVRQTELLEEAAQSAQEAGRKYINIASRLLTQEES